MSVLFGPPPIIIGVRPFKNMNYGFKSKPLLNGQQDFLIRKVTPPSLLFIVTRFMRLFLL